MTEQDIDRALDAALDEEEPRREVARTVVDHNRDHINRLLVELHVRESKLQMRISEQMDDLRATRLTIQGYETALRMLP